MLYLTRKVGESVMINDDIEVTVVEVRGRSIKLGFTFPNSVSVLRREIFDRIQEENRAAAEAGQSVSGPLPPVSTAGLTPATGPSTAPATGGTDTPARDDEDNQAGADAKDPRPRRVAGQRQD